MNYPITLLYLLVEASSKNSLLRLAIAALKVAHVLNQGQSWNLQTIKKFNAFDDVNVTKFLRCCNDDSTREVELLA